MVSRTSGLSIFCVYHFTLVSARGTWYAVWYTAHGTSHTFFLLWSPFEVTVWTASLNTFHAATCLTCFQQAAECVREVSFMGPNPYTCHSLTKT
jgi:hypothetical protein